MDNLLPQTLQSGLLIPFYDSSNSSPQDVMNKIYIDSKAFSLDLCDGLDVKGNAISNLADPISQTDRSNKRYIDTKTNNFFKNRWVRNGVYFFIFTVLVTTTKKSSNLITVPLTLSVQAARILLRSIMNWLSNNVEFMKFILEVVVREALQMSC